MTVTCWREIARAPAPREAFVTSGNAGGISNSQTLFEYSVDGDMIFGTYAGGDILQGQMVGRVLSDETIALLFHCVTGDMRLLAGEAVGTVGMNQAGRATLDFEWASFSGDRSRHRASYMEINPSLAHHITQ
jgi:hypothetical protein